MDMGYAEDVRAFQDRVLEHPLGAVERLLWHRIRWMFDLKGDPKRLPIKSRVLMEMEDLPQSTFNRARRKLESEGLIRTESHRGQDTLYEFLPIIKDGLRGQPDGQSDGQPDGQPDGRPDGQPDGQPDGRGSDFFACRRARGSTPDRNPVNNNIIKLTSPALSLMVPRNPERRGVQGRGEEGDPLAEAREIWLGAIRPGFEEFWDAYPRQECRHDAWMTWIELCERGCIDQDELMDGLTRAKRSRQWRQDNGRYVPNPVRWLSEMRWSDQMQEDPALHEELAF